MIFSFSWSQNKITIVPTNVPLEQQLNTAIPTFFPLGGKRYGDKGPTVWFQGATNMPGVWTIAPWANEQDLYTFQDDFSWVKNRHTIRAGASLSRNMKDEQQSNSEFGTLGGLWVSTAVRARSSPGSAPTIRVTLPGTAWRITSCKAWLLVLESPTPFSSASIVGTIPSSTSATPSA